MNSFQTEWTRLYRAQAESADQTAPGADPAADTLDAGLLAGDGSVRALVLELARPADWHPLSALWRAAQGELGLPAPAIAVSGVDGLQLWFSLAQAIPAARAQAFLEALRLRYLPTVALARVALLPRLVGTVLRHARPVPASQAVAERWSAFVAPDLAAIFAAEPWLDVLPNPEAQASVLARLESIRPAVFERAWNVLLPNPSDTASEVAAPLRGSASPQDLEPRRFLQNVLNNPGLDLSLRIAAARALLGKD